MTNSLPPNPSLENLRKQARTLQRSWQAGDAKAIARIRDAHPQYAHTSDEKLRATEPRLTDCQLVLAREAGFDSWPQLKVAVESARKDLVDQFVTIGCLCYDDPHFDHRSFHVRAHEMLRDNSWLAEANIWSAATAGNAAAVREFLDKDASLVHQPGPHGWVPLICACYSRVRPIDPAHSTYEVARLLLDRGADPNAYTIKSDADEGLDQTPRRFTALTGLFGGGSTGFANQPPHPRWRELAELLLQHGADPADEQALTINQSACLEMFLRYGLKSAAKVKTKVGIMTLLGRELCRAARNGKLGLVELLLAHKARIDEPLDDKTPWQHAMEHGHLEIARLLEEAGTPTSDLSDVKRFEALCLAGDGPAVQAMIERAPDLLVQASRDLAYRAVETGRMDAVRLTLDLGFDPNWMEDCAALHLSGTLAENEDLARLLMSGGASLTLREPWYDSTGVGWADFFDHVHLRDMLLSEGDICLFDALVYDRLDRVADVLARDPAALNRPFAESLSRKPKPDDWQTPLMMMVDRGKTEAVRVLLEHGADVTARHPDGRPLLQLARDKGFEEIANMLERQSSTRPL